jgi:hypothetical protein
LIPRLAVSTIAVMPGSNPLFGLNTLGGALAMQTKTGRTSPGTTVQALYGSDTRRAIEFEHGGSNTSGLNWYVAGNLFADHGWRDDSPSDVRQAFGSIGWKDPRNDITFTTSYANNSLTGNGLQEQRFLERDYASVYTKPDINDNRGAFFNVTGRRSARRNVTLSGNIYYRNIRTSGVNGDINEDSLDQSRISRLGRPACAAAAGYTGYRRAAPTRNTPFSYWRCIAQALQRDEPAEKCNGLVNSADTDQHNYGGAGQIVVTGSRPGISHQLTGGGAYDGSRVGFQQSTQLGYVVPDRSITGVDAYGDGVTGGEVDGEPYDTRIDLDGHQHLSAYATTR